MTHAELKLRVLAAARAAPSPTREEAARSATGLLVASIAFALGEFAWMAGPPHAGPGATWSAILAVAWLGPALLASWVGLSRGSSMLGRPGAALLALAVLAPLAPWGVLALAQHLLGPPPATDAVSDARCLELTGAVGLWPLLALALARRGSDPRHPASSGAALGAVAGLWSAALANLWCGSVDPAHVAVGHVLAAAAGSGLGAVLGWAVLALRRETLRTVGAVLGGAAGFWLQLQTDLAAEAVAALGPGALAALALATAMGAAAGALLGAGAARRR